MMRLIDVDEPRKTFVDWLNWYKGSEAVKSVVREAVDVLDETPTIEAEPVRHAKILYNVAIEKEECNGYKKRNRLVLQKYTCSSCYTAIDGDSKFCKECGAKLNLEE